jgi:ADP-ribosylglycohydrolase
MRIMFVLAGLSPLLCQIDLISLFASKTLVQHGAIASNLFAMEDLAGRIILCIDKTATFEDRKTVKLRNGEWSDDVAVQAVVAGGRSSQGDVERPSWIQRDMIDRLVVAWCRRRSRRSGCSTTRQVNAWEEGQSTSNGSSPIAIMTIW